MKSNVRLSTYSLIITLAVTGALLAGCVVTFHETAAFFWLLAILLVLVGFSLIYAPISIYADDYEIGVRSVLRTHRIPMTDIESVELFQPTMGAIRVCASGGYMGYWGIFREGDVGRYEAYYGKSSDCFLVRMKNGDLYVLGCLNPQAMVDYINRRLPR